MADDLTPEDIPPGYEPIAEPAWLTAMADQRLAQMMEATGGRFPDHTVVMTTLTEALPGQSIQEWDHSCDRCRKVTRDLHGGQVFRKATDGTRVVITFGACTPCKEG